VAAELIADLERIHLPKKAADKELTELVAATTLMDFHGIGPSGAPRCQSRVGDIRRFAENLVLYLRLRWRGGCSS
jgi:transposase